MNKTNAAIYRLDDTIILGALPTPSQIKKLHKEENVNFIINMCAEFPGYEKLYHELGMKQICLETPDFTIPSLGSIKTGLIEIMEIKEKLPTSSIYLHCKGKFHICKEEEKIIQHDA